MAWFAIAAAAVSAASQMKQGEDQAAASEYNAQVSEAEGQAAQISAGYEADQYGEKAKKVLATQRANAAASGLGLEGSPLEVMDETASQAAYDQLLIRYSGDTARARSLSQAALDRLQAKSSRQQGYYGGGATFLHGASMFAGSGSTAAPSTPAVPSGPSLGGGVR